MHGFDNISNDQQQQQRTFILKSTIYTYMCISSHVKNAQMQSPVPTSMIYICVTTCFVIVVKQIKLKPFFNLIFISVHKII